MEKPMQLKDIIRYLDCTDSVIIWQDDVYVDEYKPEQIFEGSIMDIPWYILDFYLSNTKDGEAISARNWGEKYNNKCGFIISVREPLEEECDIYER